VTIRRYVAVTLLVTCVTAWFSYAYFAIDEYFQVLEPARFALGFSDSFTLPWEIHERLRPMLQPFTYFVLGRAFGLRDPFVFGFVCRLVTGLACVGALALYLRTTLSWFSSEEERRLHLRVATLAGFLPYLFVRTSSETFSLAAVTAAFALLLEGSSPPRWTLVARPRRLLLVGLLFGVAFEARYHTAFLTLGLLVWMRLFARASWHAVATIVAGGLLALAVGTLVDRWGYGEWTFAPWLYFKANILEGVAAYFGSEPPFAFFWMLPANVFFPIVVVLLVLSAIAWWRERRHPLTWATLPFFLVHNLIGHKEERFVFPIAILATGLVTLALRSSPRLWSLRNGLVAKGLVAVNFALMALLALYPLGWNHHVRFTRYVHDHVGDELHAHALPDFELGLPAYHGRVYDVEKSDAATLARRIEEGTVKPWLVTDLPLLPPALEGKATLVWTELPSFADPQWVVAYNAKARPPLRRLEYRTLWKITAPRSPAPG
jgi:phosphatidylinositol glycan class B